MSLKKIKHGTHARIYEIRPEGMRSEWWVYIPSLCVYLRSRRTYIRAYPFGPLPDFDVCGCPNTRHPLLFHHRRIYTLSLRPFPPTTTGSFEPPSLRLLSHQKVPTLETLEKLLIMPKPFRILRFHLPLRHPSFSLPILKPTSLGTRVRCKHIKLITSDPEKLLSSTKRVYMYIMYEGDSHVWLSPLNDIEVAGN